MSILVLLLLISGCVTMSSHIHREYHLILENKIWDEAQSYCRRNYTDLITINSHDDMMMLVNMTAAKGVTAEIWIGLRENAIASWMWSVGQTWMSDGSVEYTNWASFPNSSHHCGGMRGDGKWLSVNCQTALPFVCQQVFTVEGSNELYVVLQSKTWREAQEHCRVNNMDLASVRNQAESTASQQVIQENGLSLAWIGLFRDEWKWSDQSKSSLRYWDSSQPNNDGVCALYNPSSKRWFDRGCTATYPFYCYTENDAISGKRKETVKQIVRVEMKSNLLVNFSDLAVREAILKQIQIKDERVKLQWRVQSDGKIFRKKKTRSSENSAMCNNDDAPVCCDLQTEGTAHLLTH